MKLQDLMTWKPPRYPMEVMLSITEIHNNELIVVTTAAIYLLVNHPDQELKFTAKMICKI